MKDVKKADLVKAYINMGSKLDDLAYKPTVEETAGRWLFKSKINPLLDYREMVEQTGGSCDKETFHIEVCKLLAKCGACET